MITALLSKINLAKVDLEGLKGRSVIAKGAALEITVALLYKALKGRNTNTRERALTRFVPHRPLPRGER